MTGEKKKKLYRIPEEGKVMGVCAGLADYFQINVTAVRVLTIIGAAMTGGTPIIIAYFVLGFALETKPLSYFGNEHSASNSDAEFWREMDKADQDPRYSAGELRRRFKDIERRTRDMEAYMTSKRFKLDRELRNLER